MKASDLGTPVKTATQSLRVGLVDLNDNTPAFTKNLYPGTVTEGNGAGTVVVTLVASDADSSFTPTYAFSTPDARFKFNGGGLFVWIH